MFSVLDPIVVLAALVAAVLVWLIHHLDKRAPPVGGVMVRAAHAMDGESFQLAERYDGFLNVRIAGIRAPLGPDEGADIARDYLAELVAGRDCRLKPVDEDPDGFLIAKVWVDGEDIADKLVARGCARPSRTLFRGAFRHEDEV